MSLLSELIMVNCLPWIIYSNLASVILTCVRCVIVTSVSRHFYCRYKNNFLAKLVLMSGVPEEYVGRKLVKLLQGLNVVCRAYVAYTGCKMADPKTLILRIWTLFKHSYGHQTSSLISLCHLIQP